MFSSQLIRPHTKLIFVPLLFLKWWYVEALSHIVYFFMYFVAKAEDMFSLLVMLKAIVLLQPMHQDYSIVGRGIGITIRMIWSFVGLCVVLSALAISLIGIVFWIVLPLISLVGLFLTLT